MIEEFKTIDNADYQITNLGRVFNTKTCIFLKPFANNNGYLAVDLFVDKIKVRKYIHRLVAEYFIENIDNEKIFVNHINGNKQDNLVSNLEWVTPSENSVHAINIGLSPIGSSKAASKLTEKDVLEIQAAFEKGEKDFNLAEKYGVTSGVISSIRLGKTWKHVSGKVFSKSGPNPIKKLTAENIPIIRDYFKKGFTDADIGKIFNVARGTINQIRQGKTWVNY